MKKRILIILFMTLGVFLLLSCQSSSNHFRDDKNGQIASSFFPKVENIPYDVQTYFEYKQSDIYEGYFLQLNFSSDSDYKQYLNDTEKTYPDMTDLQRQNSYFKIDKINFLVDDFIFRAIDLTQFGYDDEPFVGVIAHCDQTKTIVFMYFWNEFAGIETIEDGLGRNGYMEYYTDLWRSK